MLPIVLTIRQADELYQISKLIAEGTGFMAALAEVEKLYPVPKTSYCKDYCNHPYGDTACSGCIDYKTI